MKKLLLSCLSLLCALPGFSQSDDTIIQFEDQNVKSSCVEKLDTNNDGELSIGEAAAATELPAIPLGITSFNELQYFTGLTIIPDYAFNNSTCQELILPEGITSIGYRAFNWCTSLKKITLPSTLTSIAEEAFPYCENLDAVVSKVTNPFEIGGGNFTDSYHATLYVPANTKSAYQAIEGWARFGDIQEGDPGEMKTTTIA